MKDINISELMSQLPESDFTRLADEYAVQQAAEFNRRLKETEDGKAWSLYRPWDDK